MNAKFIYRPDIDVLRAISIFFVLIFHFFPFQFQGGFVGVDVFFVISGFLMTSIILEELNQENFKFVNFYSRRIVRLFPSLLTVFTFTVIVGFIFLLSDELRTVGKSLLGGIFFFSNIQLYLEAGYFDTISDLKVFLHLWSLSVEEQFYLIWPLLLFIGYKKNRVTGYILTVLLISFASNILYSYWDESLAFYMLLTRMWQLACGGAAFWFFQNRNQFNLSNSYKNILGFIGLFAVVLAPFVIDKTQMYPGFLALIPTVGATLLIAFPLSQVAGIKYFFANSVLVKLGKISYPLYLWHWVILALTKLSGIWKNDFGYQIIVIGISTLAAWITYQFIETPIRLSPNKNKTALKLVATMLVISGFGFAIVANDGFPQRYPGYETNNAENISWVPKNDPVSKDFCEHFFPEFELCSITDPQRPPNVLLIGDSHANHLFPGLSAYYSKSGKNTLLLARSGVLPFMDIYSTNRQANNLNDAFEVLEQFKETIDTVILSAIWVSYADEIGVLITTGYYKNGIIDQKNPSVRSQKQVFSNGLERTLQLLKSYSVKTVVFGGLPTLVDHPQLCKKRPHLQNDRDCRFSKSLVNLQQSAPTEILEDFHNRYSFQYYPLNSVICAEQTPAKECNVFFDGHLIYEDNHHLTIFGSHFVINNALN